MKIRHLLPVVLLGVASISVASAEPFTADILVRLDRVGSPHTSPDGEWVVYTVRQTDMEADKGRYDLWLSPTAGGAARRLTDTEDNESSPVWSSDGESIYFLSAASGSSQIWRIPADGGDPEQVTDFPVSVGTFRFAPAGDRLVFSAEVYPDCEDLACTAARDEEASELPTSGRLYPQLFMRHWDHWLTDKRSRLFSVSVHGGIATDDEPVLVSGAVDADVPSRVWGGAEEYAISNDGSTVYFAARLRNATEAWSTNFDLYRAPIDGDGSTVNFTEQNDAVDTQPLLSPDGTKLAWLAMSRPGFEADRYRIMLRDLPGGEAREIAPDWDRSPSSIAFSPGGGAILAVAQDLGNRTLWHIDIATGAATRMVDQGTVGAFDVSPSGVTFAMNNLKQPSELYFLAHSGGDARRLTNRSGPQLEDVAMGDYEQFSFAGAENDRVYGFVVKPADFEEGKKYPIAFLIHGGPQGSFSNNFHYRWNPQTYAGQGFAAVMIDFHGSTGYGQAFTDSITGDWGGKPLEDLQKGLAAAIDRYEFLDGNRVCALGASYGGYMINWIAGNWPSRFNCLVNHDGIFDNRAMAYATEELWFTEWEMGGPQFAASGGYEAFNPVNHVDKWQTPMLVIHGELDYRVPVTQGIAAFTALQRRGIPSQFLYFPDENHWVLKPHNSVQWHDAVNAWLHEYLGAQE
ncbi:MAG: S9 family peptidase [Pseudomonadota bacterium]